LWEPQIPLKGRLLGRYILFIYSLLNDAFKGSDYIVLNERILMNNEVGMMRRNAILEIFMVVPREFTVLWNVMPRTLIITNIFRGA
jgi:hypothetical protein